MTPETDGSRRERRTHEARSRRRLLVIAAVIVVLVAASIAVYFLTRDDGSETASGSTTTTTTATSSSSSTSGSSTSPSSSSSTSSSTPVPPPAATPQAYAQALFDAWKTGNRTAAATVASSGAITTIFTEQQAEAAAYTFAGCEGAAGSVYCSWTRPGGQLQMQVRDATGGLPIQVIDVTIGPA